MILLYSSAYNAFFVGQFFVCLALHGQCWTTPRRMRHNLQNLCGQELETIGTYSYSWEVWSLLLREVNLHDLTPLNT